MRGKLYKPPSNLNMVRGTSIFLAGSIEQDTAERWQDSLAEKLIVIGYDVLNPRRDDWNKCEEKITDPYFFQQVNWELDAIRVADSVIMYFDINTKSPISLLELGFLIGIKKPLVVVCPEGFWKKGNVDVMCNRYDILQENSLEEVINAIKELNNVKTKSE